MWEKLLANFVRPYSKSRRRRPFILPMNGALPSIATAVHVFCIDGPPPVHGDVFPAPARTE
jgi:hypothetical protein